MIRPVRQTNSLCVSIFGIYLRMNTVPAYGSQSTAELVSNSKSQVSLKGTTAVGFLFRTNMDKLWQFHPVVSRWSSPPVGWKVNDAKMILNIRARRQRRFCRQHPVLQREPNQQARLRVSTILSTVTYSTLQPQVGAQKLNTRVTRTRTLYNVFKGIRPQACILHPTTEKQS